MALYLGSNQVAAVVSQIELPNIQSMSVSQNGTYYISGSITGYNPITVEVLPNIQSLTVSQNGVYSVSGSVNGFNPVVVDITQGSFSSVLAYSGVGSIVSNNTIGYASAIMFSNVTKLPDNFIILLTPQRYNNGGGFGHVNDIYNAVPAIHNIVYNGTVTSTYLLQANYGSCYVDDNEFVGAHTSSFYLTSWSYNNNTHILTCSIVSSGPTYFAVAESGYGNYPAPAYTLYYM